MGTRSANRAFGGASVRWRALAMAALVAVVVPAVAPASEAQSVRRAEPKSGLTPEERQKVLDETLSMAPDEPNSPDDPFRVLHERERARDDAALARLEASRISDAANVESFIAATTRNRAQAAADAATVRRDAAKRRLEAERRRLSDLTVRAYVTGGSLGMEEYRAYLDGDTTDPAAGRELMFNQVLQRQEEVTAAVAKAMLKARKALLVAKATLVEATAFAEERAANAERLGQVRISSEQRHEGSIVDVGTARSRLRAAGGRGFALVPESVALIGIPRLSAEDLSGWFARSAYRPRVSTPIADFARWFIAEGAAEGIRGDIAFAQAVLETGGFANNDSVNANNFSGIGHCDLCPSGWVFPSPRSGARAQMQLLKSYAIRGPKYVYPMVDRRLRGPAGCCQTWADLTTVWATDPTYGPKVMLIYSDIVNFALSRRAAGQGFDDPPVELAE